VNLAVVFGTPSVEHLGSCVSGTRVADILSQQYRVKRILIGMDGEWQTTQQRFSYADQAATRKFYDFAQTIGRPQWGRVNLAQISRLLSDVDVVLPLTHGPYGESGLIQGFLETLGIPYVGPGVEACVLTQHKDLIKSLAKDETIPVSPFVSFSQIEWQSDPSVLLTEINQNLDFPMFVKPNDGGSSIGISKVTPNNRLEAAIDKAFTFSQRVIVEQGVDGYEIECSVIGNDEIIVADTLGEVIPSNEFYDVAAKYVEPSEIAIPARNIDRGTAKQVKDLARKIYRLARACGFCRIDFLVDKRDKTPYLNEVTAIPGCTEYSLFPRLFVQSGWQEVKLWEKIVNLAWERFKKE